MGVGCHLSFAARQSSERSDTAFLHGSAEFFLLCERITPSTAGTPGEMVRAGLCKRSDWMIIVAHSTLKSYESVTGFCQTSPFLRLLIISKKMLLTQVNYQCQSYITGDDV